MSEGFTVDISTGEIAGIVVKNAGDRGFRFHASIRQFEAMDGHVFVSPVAAQAAARDLERGVRRPFRQSQGRFGVFQ